jgi:hypothetical protein
VPLLFFWGLGTWFFHRALKSRLLLDYVGFGTSVGLGFCSKYHIVLLPLSAAIYLLVKEKDGKKARWDGILLSTVMFFIFSAPVWIWNFQNNFDSFAFQLKHGLGEQKFHPENILIYILGQALLVFPTLVPFFFREVRARAKHWLTVWSLVPIVFFLLTSWKGRVEPNWAIPAYTALFALIAHSQISAVHIRNVLVTWGLATAVVYSAIMLPRQFVWMQETRLKEIYMYDILLPYAKNNLPFFASSYQMASTLSYSLNRTICKIGGMGRRDYFDYLPECRPLGEFYIVVRQWDKLPDWVSTDRIVQRTHLNSEFELLTLRGP